MRLKTFAIFLNLCLLCLEAYPQGYFCNKQGTVLEYVRKETDGSFVWRLRGTVVKVTDMGSYDECSTESEFTRQNGKPLYKSKVLQTVTIDHESGEVGVDVAGAMSSFIKARVGLNANCTRTLSSLPADVKPGDVLPSVEAEAKVGPLTYKVEIFERKVLRSETLTVPAGTFDCVVVEEHKVESGPGHNRDVINHTWYAKGVGYIRHDSYIKGKLDTSEILYSIK